MMSLPSANWSWMVKVASSAGSSHHIGRAIGASVAAASSASACIRSITCNRTNNSGNYYCSPDTPEHVQRDRSCSRTCDLALRTQPRLLHCALLGLWNMWSMLGDRDVQMFLIY